MHSYTKFIPHFLKRLHISETPKHCIQVHVVCDWWMLRNYEGVFDLYMSNERQFRNC